MLLGAHVRNDDPLEAAAARGADAVQMFLSDPQSWKPPQPRADAAALRSSGMPIYVHSPYLVNVGSPNNRIRIPSRKIIADTVAAAAEIGALGVIVHGGHVGDDEDVAVGLERWRKALEAIDLTVPVLIENTAGGEKAIVRQIDAYARLWDEIGEFNVGVCLDTCHAWASGEYLATVVERLVAAVGRIDLVHGNDSRDPAGSWRDRHANLGDGEIPEDQFLGVIRAANATTIVETPGGDAEHAADIAWLRGRL
jgi:deoxyribonuclease-4